MKLKNIGILALTTIMLTSCRWHKDFSDYNKIYQIQFKENERSDHINELWLHKHKNKDECIVEYIAYEFKDQIESDIHVTIPTSIYVEEIESTLKIKYLAGFDGNSWKCIFIVIDVFSLLENECNIYLDYNNIPLDPTPGYGEQCMIRFFDNEGSIINTKYNLIELNKPPK